MAAQKRSVVNADSVAALNDRELEALRLLAQGHTAKSIAEKTGRSINAVNDSLRDARRKTGMGSSRELARAIGVQENRAEKIGVHPVLSAGQGEALDVRPVAAGRLDWRRTGMIVGLIAGLICLLFSVLLLARPHRGLLPSLQSDTGAMILQDMTLSVPDPRAMNAALNGERRDPVWAASTENRLFGAYKTALKASVLAENVRVRCGRTICEVAAMRRGRFEPADEVMLKTTLTQAEFPSLHAAGLVSRGLTTIYEDGPDARLAFLAYWQGPPRP